MRLIKTVFIKYILTGTRYAIAKGTELKAVEKKQPQAVATFITNTTAMAVMVNALKVDRRPVIQ
uniref:Uncharacterized protein n=1 Tax=Glossina palpalis gambiensis TaxID=67801 RepID=A0A1B0B6P0_9MUSC